MNSKKLVRALEGNLSGEKFIKHLLLEQVYMPIQDELHAIKGFQRSTKAQPLLVEDEEATQFNFNLSYTLPNRPFEIKHRDTYIAA